MMKYATSSTSGSGGEKKARNCYPTFLVIIYVTPRATGDRQKVCVYLCTLLTRRGTAGVDDVKE